MKTVKRQRYSNDFKDRALTLVGLGRPVPEVAAELGTGTDLAVEVREYFIPDFSHWKDHDAFEAAFARLLQDFRQSTQPNPRP
jgi:hypothetical protein